jgi:hypothetical protein
MFVMVYDWFWLEILPMVWNGPLHENYRGRMERVFPMQTVVTLGSHFTLNTPNPSKPTLTHLELCFVQLGQLGPPLYIESVIVSARIRSVARAACMCILAETGMFCEHKWVTHAAY